MFKIEIWKRWSSYKSYLTIGPDGDFETGDDLPLLVLRDVSSCIAFPYLEQVTGIDVDGTEDEIREVGVALGEYMAPLYGAVPDMGDYRFTIVDNVRLLLETISDTMNRIWDENIKSLDDEQEEV